MNELENIATYLMIGKMFLENSFKNYFGEQKEKYNDRRAFVKFEELYIEAKKCFGLDFNNKQYVVEYISKFNPEIALKYIGASLKLKEELL